MINTTYQELYKYALHVNGAHLGQNKMKANHHRFDSGRDLACYGMFNTLRPRQDGLHFPDDIFKCIFLNDIVSISIKISLKFVP